MKKYYDLAFSLGEACSCADTLVRAGLRKFSCPFDWLFGTDFLGRVDIFCSDFDRFLLKEDLVDGHCTNEDKYNPCEVYRNQYTQLGLNHDFPVGIPFDESYPVVKEKYDRRINRLLENVKKAEKILCVYIETPITDKHTVDSDILAGWEQIHQKYPDKKIDLFYFQYNPAMKPEQFTKTILSENITKVVANYKDLGKNAPIHSVNFRFLKRQLSGVRLNIPMGQRIKAIIAKWIICCVPIKSMRRKLRKKYHLR